MDVFPDAPIDLAEACEINGEAHPDHDAVSLNVLHRDGRHATVSIPASDLGRLVPLLLLLGRDLPARKTDKDEPLCLVPTDGLHVGPLPSGETLLVVAVGPATMGLSMPAAVAEKLGYSLIAAAAQPPKGSTPLQ